MSSAVLADAISAQKRFASGAAENGAVSVAWQGASGQQTAEVPEGMLTALDDVAYAAFMEKLALRDDVPLYMNQLDYPLPMNDGEAIVIEDGGEQAAEDAEALMAAADGTVIKLNKTEITIGLKEPYAGLVATVEDAEGNPVTGAAVTWTSDNVKIAKVDAKGVVTGVKRETTTIHATLANGATAAVKVNVVKAPTKVVLPATTMEIGATVSLPLKPSVPADTACSTYTFTSNKPEYATVDQNGVVTGVYKGVATITVKAYNGKKATCKVTVHNQPKTIAPVKAELSVGEEMTAPIEIKALDAYGAATVASLTYAVDPASPNPDSITVDADGVVTGVKKGEATVLVTSGELSTSVKVYVVATPGDLTLSQSDVALGVKEECGWIAATAVPKTGEEKCVDTVTWRSSNVKIAKVDANTGVITGVKTGSAVVYASTCNGIERAVKVTVAKAPTKLTLTPATLKITEDMTVPLDVQVNKGAACSTYTYESNDPAVVTVDAKGNVTGHGTGTAVVTVISYNKKKATLKVEGLGLPRALTLKESVIDLAVAQKAKLEAAVTDLNGVRTETTYTYAIDPASADPGCVTVAADGTVTAVAKGSAVINVTTHNGITAACAVNVVDAPESISLNETALELGVKDVYDGLVVEKHAPAGAERCAAIITWKTSDAKVAKVDENGVITALKKGTATVTATTHNGKSASVVVKVLKAPSKLTLNYDKTTMSVDMTLALEATPNKDSASHTILWTTSNPAVATVDAKGVVTAVGRGSATITAATFNKKTAKCVITVYSKPDKVRVDGELTILAGMTGSLKPKALDAENYEVPANFTYAVDASSADPACVTVSALTGVVTGNVAGSAVIRVSIGDGSIYTTYPVTVKPAPQSIDLKVADTVTLGKGEVFPGAEVEYVYPEGAETGSVGLEWTSSNAKVAKVDAAGVVTAVKAGTVTITATTQNNKSDSYTVKVVSAPRSATLNKTALTLTPGMTEQLTASVNSGAASYTGTFESSDPSVATVDANGLVTAVAGGKAVITYATFNGKKATCAVTVNSLPAEVYFDKDALTLPEGDKATLSAYALDDKGGRAVAQFTYQVIEGADSVSLTGAGVVTGVKQGTAVIRVTTQNGISTHLSGGSAVDTVCRITVTPAPASITMQANAVLEGDQTLQLNPVVKDGSGNVIADCPVTYVVVGTAVTVSETGLVTAVRGGKATVTARTANGKSAACQITVDKERYRFFGSYNYFLVGEGALYFPENNALSVETVLSDANIGGLDYEMVGMVKNPSKAVLLDAIDDAFADSVDDDINVVYLCSHGYNYIDVPTSFPTHYGLQIPGYSGYKSDSRYYVTAEEIYAHISRIRGTVVLILDSCFSGEFITNMYSELEAEGGRISVLTAASNTKACYYNIKDTARAYDYFTYYLLGGAGYDMSTHLFSGSMPADKDKNGELTVRELFNYAKSEVTTNVPKFKKQKTFHGDANQMPRVYLGGNGDLVLYARG